MHYGKNLGYGLSARFLSVVFLIFIVLPVWAAPKTPDPNKTPPTDTKSDPVPILQPPAQPPKPGKGPVPVIQPPSQTIKPGIGNLSQQPDLAITRLEWSKAFKEGDRIGIDWVLHCEVQNKGSVAAPGTIIRFEGGIGCPRRIDDSKPIPGLLAGKSYSVSWPNASKETWPAGTYNLTVVVDPTNLVKDPDRKNNLKTITFTIGPPKPALNSLPTLVQPQPDAPKPGANMLKVEPIQKTLPQPAAGTGRRAVTLDIDMDRSTVLNTQVGKRIVIMDIAMDRSMVLNTEVGRRTVLMDIVMERSAVLNTEVGKRSVPMDIALDPLTVGNAQVGKRTVIMNIQVE